jgi:hypothetical protein
MLITGLGVVAGGVAVAGLVLKLDLDGVCFVAFERSLEFDVGGAVE